MKKIYYPIWALVPILLAGSVLAALAQIPDAPPPQNGDPGRGGPPGQPGGFGGGPGGGRGGRGGIGQPKRKLVSQFDKNGDHYLDAEERKAAYEFLQNGGGGGRRGRGGFGGGGEAGKPGPKVSPADVKNYPDAKVFQPDVVRTFFLEFEDANWEKEMASFKNTDIDVPARVTIDGKVYKDVGIHFRGASSFMMVQEGSKRSLNLSFDFRHKDQNFGGYHTLNLLNSHEDATFLRPVLYYEVSKNYIPSPKVNFVKLVINGESWGVYINTEQFDKDFLKEAYGSSKGARWKVPGSPNARGSLAYIGDDPAAYKGIYEIKGKDEPKPWNDLVHLCKVLNETPQDKLEAALAPILDVDEALKFIALDNALINDDGYWIRTSDYSIFEDEKGRFHILPHDTNETFSRPGGPGMGGRGGGGGRRGGPGGGPGGPGPGADGLAGGQGGGRGPGGPGGQGRGGFGGGGQSFNGVELDPLFAANDPNKPLVSKLLAVPEWRARYLGYTRDIASKWLDWKTLGPIATRYHSMIAADVKADTRKLESAEAFDFKVDGSLNESGPGPTISLKDFADQRRAYLLNYKEVAK